MTAAHPGRAGRCLLCMTFLATAVLLAGVPAKADAPAYQGARALLDSARAAYNAKNYPFAATRFREFLNRFGNDKDAPHARYGLALALLDGPDQDFAGAAAELRRVVDIKDFPDRPFVLYYLGRAQRGLGTREAARAAQHFAEAAGHFAAAEGAFLARAKPPGAKELSEDSEWAARARCDLAEMLLRTGKAKEARAAAKVLVDEPRWAKSRYRGLALYYHGFACFQLRDYVLAGRSLNALTPFADPAFGSHARYLLARVHHLTDEHAEAALHYEGVLGDYARSKQAAAEALKRPDQLRNDPGERARLQRLVNEPPDYVARAAFFLGVLRYEAGRFGDALANFADFEKQYRSSPLVAEARLRQGLCQVQLKQFRDAVATLQPLADREPRLADEALLWIGKAHAAAADPNRPQSYGPALDALRRAADRAQQRIATDPDAANRRAEILLELADTQQFAKQYKEAAAIYGQLLNEKRLPQRAEELLQRQATALHLAGDYANSDQVCQRFRQQYPTSTLLPAVLFRYAENAYFQTLAAEKNPNLPNRAAELTRLQDETIKRYREVVDQYPDFAHANLARYALGVTYHCRGDIDKARAALEAVPPTDRTGELTAVSYLLADCLIRQAPAKVDDALAAGKAQEQLQGAITLLDGYVSAQLTTPHVPDALLKLGYCHQRMAALLAQPAERNKELAAARMAYEKLMQQFSKHPLFAQAVLERAKCLALAGDANAAIRELQRFRAEPLRAAPLAPMALLQLAAVLRGLNKPAEAAQVLDQCRKQYEASLHKDPARAGWVIVLQYHHGVALREAGKPAEARAVFALAMKQSPDRPEAAEAALRYAQCLREEGANRAKPQPVLLREAVQFLEGQIRALKDKLPTSEVWARLLYELAWAHRTLDEIAKPAGGTNSKATEAYQELRAAFPDLPLAQDAAFELAELLADRGEADAAVKLLNDVLEKEPAPELADKVRLRIGACLATKGDGKEALAYFEALTQNSKPPLAGQARYRAGELLLRHKEYAKAAAHLQAFRDQPSLQNVPGLTDRALLRLGHAYAYLGQWDRSRQAHEMLTSRFGQSVWVHEARYGIGWAWQNQKNYDQAVNAYQQVVHRTDSETAAKAQLQIGLCRMAQRRYAEAANALLVVPFTYDFPELNAAALCEAARCFVELKQQEQAARLLRRVLKDHAGSKWAEVAKQRLQALPGG